MSKNIANIILFSLIGLIAIFGWLNLSVKDEYKTKKESYVNFEKSAKEIYLVKRLKKGMPAILSSLSSIKKPTIKDRATSKIYIFENLNLNDLNRLIKRIQGSYIPIKKLEIKRDMTNHAMVTMEVVK
jgi:hypothetical protein